MRQRKTDRRIFLAGALAISALGAGFARAGSDAAASESRTFDVRSFGAKGDGRTKDTRALQAAVDACHQAGGGTVLLPPGTYLSGSVRLGSDVRLHLDHGATLLASPERSDFDPYEKLGFKNAADVETSFFHHSLLWAEDAERVAVTGTGQILGNRKRRGGPKMIALKRCRHVAVRDLTIRDSPNYCVSLLGTDYVSIDGVTILNGFADGIDPDCCRHVRIANCHIESWDDAIVPKTSRSLGDRRSTENVTVTNCVLASACNCFKLGTESGGDFRNIAVCNCVMFPLQGKQLPISGISLLSVDGSNIEGVAVSNVTMKDVRCPIFLRLGNRGRDLATPVPGSLRDVVISDVVATGAKWPCAVVGITDHPVEGVSLRNLRLACRGGGTRDEARAEVPELVAKYPTADMFATYPSYGFYFRHARDVRVSCVDFRCGAPDARPAVVCDDVSRLTLDALGTPAPDGGGPVVRLRQVHGALVRGCTPTEGTKVFLEVSGTDSKGISLSGNDFAGVGKPVACCDGAPPVSATEGGNSR